MSGRGFQGIGSESLDLTWGAGYTGINGRRPIEGVEGSWWTGEEHESIAVATLLTHPIVRGGAGGTHGASVTGGGTL